jgi:hypothetical protein
VYVYSKLSTRLHRFLLHCLFVVFRFTILAKFRPHFGDFAGYLNIISRTFGLYSIQIHIEFKFLRILFKFDKI